MIVIVIAVVVVIVIVVVIAVAVTIASDSCLLDGTMLTSSTMETKKTEYYGGGMKTEQAQM
jgi:uncharacterized membrane protein